MGNSQSNQSNKQSLPRQPSATVPTPPQAPPKPRKDDFEKLYAALRVDWGYLTPQNALYPAIEEQDDPPEIKVIRQLIMDRKMAPFYKGLADASNSIQISDMDPRVWQFLELIPNSPDSNDLVGNLQAAMNSPIESRHRHTQSVDSAGNSLNRPTIQVSSPRLAVPALAMRPTVSKEDLYIDAVECPICFLTYPRNINWTRCCDQPICTECFIQIKRPESGEPATCPYCVEPDFGIVYQAPNNAQFKEGHASLYTQDQVTTSTARVKDGERQRRKKSLGYQDPNVVVSDQLRPDWYQRHQQELMQRALQQQQRRYAQMLAVQRGESPLIREPSPPRRQVSSSGTVIAEQDLAGAAQAAAALVENLSGLTIRDGRRRQPRSGSGLFGSSAPASTQSVPVSAQHIQAVRNMGADIEEIMMMEAVRRSLLEMEDKEATRK